MARAARPIQRGQHSEGGHGPPTKQVAGFAEAVRDIPDGAVIALGGFAMPGVPYNLIKALHAQGAKQLTCVANTTGGAQQPRMPDIGMLVENGQVEEGDLRLHRGDARLRRAAVHQILRIRRGRGGAGATGHAGGTIARGRRRHSRLLYADRGGHGAGRGARDAGDQRARIPAGIRAAGGLRLRAGDAGRHVRQPAVSSLATQFQSGDGDGGAHDDRRGR